MSKEEMFYKLKVSIRDVVWQMQKAQFVVMKTCEKCGLEHFECARCHQIFGNLYKFSIHKCVLPV